MINNFNKARWILNNEGPGSLGKKTVKVINRKLGVSKTLLSPGEAYNYLSNPLFGVTQKDILKSSKSSAGSRMKPSSALWFVPYFDHVTFGGIYTIFRFIEEFANRGLKTTIVIFDNKYFERCQNYAIHVNCFL